MNKIEQGIQINQEHLLNVQNSIEENPSFADKILSLGFDSLEDFFTQKKIYLLQQSVKDTICDVSNKEAIPSLFSLVEQETPGIVIVIAQEICVHKGKGKESNLDEDYCAKNNISIYPYDLYGGNILATPGDCSLGLVVPLDVDLDLRFVLEQIKSILDKYLDNLSIQGNDILMDGKKIVGTSSLRTDKFFCFISHFSMNNKTELVEKVCGQPLTGKEVGFINQEILSSNQLKQEVLRWLQGR